MFFRLTNATGTFQSHNNKILAEKFNVFVIVYFDNIFIHTKSGRKEYVKAV